MNNLIAPRSSPSHPHTATRRTHGRRLPAVPRPPRQVAFIALDTETTGLEPGSRLVELACQACAEDGTVLSTFHELVNPGMPMPADTSARNGLTDSMLALMPSTQDVLRYWLAWLPSNPVLVIHYAPFDVGILGYELDRAGLPHPKATVIDTCAMARSINATARNSLSALVEHYRIKVDGPAHNALPDTEAVRQYFLIARGLLPDQPISFAPTHRCPRLEELPDHLRLLPEWVSSATRLRMVCHEQDGSTCNLWITPYGWAVKDGRLLVHGWCHDQEQRLTIPADRVMAIRRG